MKHKTLLLLLPALLAFLSPIATAADSPGSTLLFLGGHAVQQELQLTPAQVKKIDALRSEYRSQARAITQATPLGQPAPKTLDRLQTLTGKYDARALAVLSDNQVANLTALQHRTLGAWMITLPKVQDKLELSQAQRAQVGEILEKFDATVDELNRKTFAGEISNARRLDLLKAARVKETRNLRSILTRDQRKALECLAQSTAPLPREGCAG